MTVYLPENLRDMRLFVAVYEERSFTAAAQRENATQSGVSQHVRKLEEMLGSQLLVRRAGSVLPTPAGDAFYAGCIKIFHALDEVRSKLVTFESGLQGEAKVGITPTLARCVLAPALSRFVTQYPNVLVQVHESYSAAVTDRVRAGELDVAIVPALTDDVGIIGRLVVRTPEYLVTSVATAEALGLHHGLARLPGLKLVLPSHLQARRALLDRYIIATSLEVVRRLEMDSMFGTLDFVATTDWAAILPAIMLARRADPRLFAIPLQNPSLSLDVYRIESVGRPLSTAARMLTDILEEETCRQQSLIESTHGWPVVRVETDEL